MKIKCYVCGTEHEINPASLMAQESVKKRFKGKSKKELSEWGKKLVAKRKKKLSTS
jgi:hypothetical protein